MTNEEALALPKSHPARFMHFYGRSKAAMIKAIPTTPGGHTMPQHTPVRATQISFNEGLLRLAAIHDKQVEFRYAKGEGAIIELRALKPADVKIIKLGKPDEHVTVTGFDPDRGEVRHYRLDRIKGDVRIAS